MSHVLDGLLEHVREGREHTRCSEDARVQSFFEARAELFVAMHYARLSCIADYLMVSDVYNARFCQWGVTEGETIILSKAFGPKWKIVSADAPGAPNVTSAEFGGTTFLVDNSPDGVRVIALTTSMRDDNAAREGLAQQRGETK